MVAKLQTEITTKFKYGVYFTLSTNVLLLSVHYELYRELFKVHIL